MGKRSSFKRVERDFYVTPKKAVLPLLPMFKRSVHFYEPCVGNGDLVNHLDEEGHICVGQSDIEVDATSHQYKTDAELFITNPPWDRKVLHPLIVNLSDQRATWLLFDADWMHTKQSAELMKRCLCIVSVGRIKWIPESKMTGKDNCCWYLFGKPTDGSTVFFGR